MSKKSIQIKISNVKKVNKLFKKKKNAIQQNLSNHHILSNPIINDDNIPDLTENVSYEPSYDKTTAENFMITSEMPTIPFNFLNNKLMICENESTVEYVKKTLQENAVKYNMNRNCVSSISKDLSIVFPSLPKDSRTLLKTPRTTITRKVPPGEYAHFSLLRTLKLLSKNKQNNFVSIMDFFLGSVSFFTDAIKKSFWILLGKCEEKIFCVGLYHGIRQPYNFNEFIEESVKEMKLLTTEGFENEEVNVFSCILRNFCADLPARAHLTYTTHHMGLFACPFCDIEGYKCDNRTIFDETDCHRRTNSEFRNRTNPQNHKGTSILELELKIVIVVTE